MAKKNNAFIHGGIIGRVNNYTDGFCKNSLCLVYKSLKSMFIKLQKKARKIVTIFLLASLLNLAPISFSNLLVFSEEDDGIEYIVTGTAVSGEQEELKIAINGDTVENVVEEIVDKIPPTVIIDFPENNQTYKNNQILEIKYTAVDNISSSDKIKTELFLDGQILDSDNNKIDLSLEHLGAHTVSAIAQDEAGNKSQETKISFESKTDIGAIMDNVRHYFDLNLISKKSTKQLLEARLKIIQNKIKLVSDIQNKKNFGENINREAKDILAEGLKFIEL